MYPSKENEHIDRSEEIDPQFATSHIVSILDSIDMINQSVSTIGDVVSVYPDSELSGIKASLEDIVATMEFDVKKLSKSAY